MHSPSCGMILLALAVVNINVLLVCSAYFPATYVLDARQSFAAPRGPIPEEPQPRSHGGR